MLKPDLILLHYAGGNVYSFNFIMPYLEKKFNIIPIELPGRGKRIKEKLLFDKNLAVRDVLNQILDNIGSNQFIIYGHSMGASLGFSVISELEKRKFYPLCFVASGNPGPNIKNDIQRYDLPKEKFISELKLLGGIENEIIENKQLFDFFEPILRADFEIVEKESDLNGEIKISTPIYALMGDKEKFCCSIQNWKNYTTSNFKYKLLSGNHFFIYDHPKEIAEFIKESYETQCMYKGMFS
ncbi:alpha/beta fold hydrolase [Zhouia spongiae]|uniref:Alpha/beta fold hydrolase n=1 Tax=Zhouia spongiae TaxID=2202721 RepID=A0ABY3YLD1_9FLAO|nr:alpha/beta fold hydrolase [Zhouia spongiae]UNY98301.1 alpha/beta fold hydrolase [Zhouia spongiae]